MGKYLDPRADLTFKKVFGEHILQPVYALNFVNENFMNDVDDYYHYYHLVHDKYTDKVIDGLHLIFVVEEVQAADLCGEKDANALAPLPH